MGQLQNGLKKLPKLIAVTMMEPDPRPIVAQQSPNCKPQP